MEVEQVVTAAGKKAILKLERMSSDRVRVKRKTLEAVLGECQIALQLLSTTGFVDEVVDDDDDDYSVDCDEDDDKAVPPPCRDDETAELCDLIKSRVECADFLEKLESAQASVSQNMAGWIDARFNLFAAEESTSWDMVNENDLWEGGNSELDQEYVLVRQEDIVDGIACFMAAYLLSLKQTKELTPNQLQEALCKTFSVKKKKGKLRKAWDGSKVIYNVASWGATAIGIYQNPAILKVATAAFWTSCHVISKLF